MSNGPSTLVIVGVSGDLAARKLLPALYKLEEEGRLAADFRVIGAARREVTLPGVMKSLKAELAASADAKVLARLRRRIRLLRMDSGDPRDYEGLLAALGELETGAAGATRLFYLSVPPTATERVVEALGMVGLNQPAGVTTRLLLEKPFGVDEASARALDRGLHRVFNESQIYRIDHYVAKEIPQNIVTVRQHNPLLREVWNRRHVSLIEIEARERIGIEGRADFYEQTGALRDIVQNHLLALTALVMMDEPKTGDVAGVHRERVRLLQAVRRLSGRDVNRRVARGQYRGYREEVGNPDSQAETYVRLELEVASRRWRGVPVVLTTGKHLEGRHTEVRVHFKGSTPDAPNCLRFRWQPEEAIELKLNTKLPGYSRDLAGVWLRHEYEAVAGQEHRGYGRVILEALAGDQTNFTCGDEVLATWRIVDPIVRHWRQQDERGGGPQLYEPGSTGPSLH